MIYTLSLSLISSESALSSNFPAEVDIDRYFSDEVFRDATGNGDEEEEEEEGLTRRGVNASSGPREGVEAVKLPEGVAVKNVPLSH